MKKIILAASLIFLLHFNAYSDQNDPKLEILFSNLLKIQSEAKAQPTVSQIWSIWSVAKIKEAQIKFDIGSQLMGNKQFKNSIKMYSKAIDLQPDFAEAWNKRATLHYIIGDYEKSISDIFRTLELEPRHFGALDGLAEIYFLQNKFSKAAQTYNKILEILPYSKKAKMRLEYIQQSFI